MIHCDILVICLVVTQGTALTFSRKGRYIPNLKIAEEIDISDVSFTTPSSVASVAETKVNQRSKPRIIVPVVTYHKANHPVFGFSGNSYKNRKPKTFKYIPLIRSGNDVFGQGVASKVVLIPNYRKYNAVRKPKPVYYLVGDEPAKINGNHNTQARAAGKHGESFRLYNERELQFLKPYPKKHSSGLGYNYNHNNKPDDYEDETDTSDNVQMVGQSTDNMPSAKGDRVEFQMYGMDGPNSYKFGYDTGKGFEERDSDGKIKGHYGYMDNEGKMRIMKYEADPETGFHAGPVDLSSDESN